MSGQGTAKGKVELKSDHTAVSTFTLDDGRSFKYSGKLSLPEIYTVKDCVCDATLHYKAPSQAGDYSWKCKKEGETIVVTVEANGGNTIVINIPAENLVKRSNPGVAFFDANVHPQGSFSLGPMSAA